MVQRFNTDCQDIEIVKLDAYEFGGLLVTQGAMMNMGSFSSFLLLQFCDGFSRRTSRLHLNTLADVWNSVLFVHWRLMGSMLFSLCRSRHVRGGLAGKRGFQQGQRQRLQPAPLRSVRTPAEISSAEKTEPPSSSNTSSSRFSSLQDPRQ